MSITFRWTVTLALATLLLIAGTMGALELGLRAEETRARTRWLRTHRAQLEERLELVGLRAQRNVAALMQSGELTDLLAPYARPGVELDRRVVSWAERNATRFGLDQVVVLSSEGRILTDAFCASAYGEVHPAQAWLWSCVSNSPALWRDRRCGAESHLDRPLHVLGAVEFLRLGPARFLVAGGQALDESALDAIGAPLDWIGLHWGTAEPAEQEFVLPAGWQPEAPTVLAARLDPSPAAQALDAVRGWAGVGALLVFLVATLAVAPWLARGLARPLMRLEQAVQAIGEGSRRLELSPEGPTEVRNLTRALVDMTGALAEAETRIRAAERRGAWREIAQRIAHEIKNTVSPLSLALDNVETVVRRSGLHANRQLDATLRTAREQLASLDRLVGEFRTFARAPRLQTAPLDVGAVCRAALAAVEQVHPDTPLRVVEVDALPPVWGDAEQLRRALHNLVLNAVESAPEHPVEVRFGRGPGGDRWWMAVRDQGAGPPNHVASRLGEPYLSTKERGSGLGLAVVAQIAEAHGGRLASHHPAVGGFEIRLEGLRAQPREGGS